VLKKTKTHSLAKATAVLLVAALGIATAVTSCRTVAPVPERETGIRDGVLHRFVRFAEGKYGYDFDIPVPYHPFTDEPVRIPEVLVPVKHQFRAAWVATVFSLNKPNTTSREGFQREFIHILDTLVDWNMNAVIFQVRPLLDAFYPSEINPWSQHVTGTYVETQHGIEILGRQGVDPGWDPLEWMIAETHKRGLEYHAWFNPFRVTASRHRFFNVPGKTNEELAELSASELVQALNGAGILADNNFAVLNPDMVFMFDERLYLDAGIPEVRQHVFDTIREVVERYDIDAVHFDDYFYPYFVRGQRFGDLNEDRATFERFGLGRFPDTAEGIEAWRRDNNTELIRGVREVITEENRRNNRAIQLGISPFGIWEHYQNDPRGSHTPTGSGRTFSGQVFADTYKWVREELIDYIAPQIYWSFDQRAAPYAELVRWWAQAADGVNVHLYIGHANYKHVTNGGWEVAWLNPEEIYRQLKYNQLHPQVRGSIFFSFTDLIPSAGDEPRHIAAAAATNLLREVFRRHKTLNPPMPWLMESAPAVPINVRQNGNVITWEDTLDNNTRYYVVYRVRASSGVTDADTVVNDPNNIVARVWRNGQAHTFTDNDVRRPQRYTYFVTAVNAANMESEAVIATRRR